MSKIDDGNYYDDYDDDDDYYCDDDDTKSCQSSVCYFPSFHDFQQPWGGAKEITMSRMSFGLSLLFSK